MNLCGDYMTNVDHKFNDEWLVRLVEQAPGLTPGLLAKWRSPQRPYLSQALVDAEILGMAELAGLVHRAFRIDVFDFGTYEPDEQAINLVPEDICRKHQLFPVGSGHRSIQVAMPNPLDAGALDVVGWTTGRKVVPLFCLPSQLDQLLNSRFHPDAVIYDLVKRFHEEEEVEVLSSPKAREEGSDGEVAVRTPVVRLVNVLITDAFKRGASDIHIEHEDKSSLVRFRIDGRLRNVMVLPRYVGAGPVVARIKIMAQLDIAVRFRPQDGRAKIRIGNEEIGLRVSTLPTRLGEKVVIRILDERASQVPFDALGFRHEIGERLEVLIRQHQGILLVTGPTGSGKTTTLYSALNRIKSEDVNIVTIEDPVEYRLQGVSQVQVEEKKGLTFAAILRSVLRQDPDIVMVGEIRDVETAEISCQAALTGHLVLSTLHTNDTVSSITRLLDMGVPGFKIAAGVIGITAQRLVRRLCPACAAPADMAQVDSRVTTALAAQFAEPRVLQPAGCPACGYSGYKGRIALVELLEITPVIRDAIGQSMTAERLRGVALEEGALWTLSDDILHHLQQGHTSLEEVLPYMGLVSAPRPAGETLTASAATGDVGAGQRAAETPKSPVRCGIAGTVDDGVCLPDSTGAAQGHAEASSAPMVLLAEADEAVGTRLSDLLQGDSLRVIRRSGGAKVLETLAREAVDLIIVDASLTGCRELIQAVRNVLGMTDVPILALMQGHDGTGLEALLDAGADDYIQTGLPDRTTLARVKGALFRKSSWPTTEEVMRPPTPASEAERMDVVRSTTLLDTAPEERFDWITRKAAATFDVPFAYVAIVADDRQWFKSRKGLEAEETARDVAFCAHAINYDEPLVVPDALLDYRFSENPLVQGDPGIRFYAGVPLRSPEGLAVGTFCIADRVPRELSAAELETLQGLARQVEEEIWAQSPA